MVPRSRDIRINIDIPLRIQSQRIVCIPAHRAIHKNVSMSIPYAISTFDTHITGFQVG